MAIANVTLNNTFEQWRGITNQLTVAVNEFESNGNLMRVVSNTSSIVPTPNVGRGHIIHIGTNLSDDTSNTGQTIIPSALAVNSVMTLATAGYEVVNAAFTQSNTDNVRLSANYVVTNSVFRQANTDNVRLSAAYVVLNSAFTQANTDNVRLSAAYVVLNSAFTQSNTDNVRLSAAYVVTNSVFRQSNTDNVRLTAAYTQSNTDNVRLSGAYVTLNAAFTQSNTDNIRLSAAYVVTNASFTHANNAHGRIDLLSGNASVLTATFQNSYDVVNSAFRQSNTDNVRLTAAYVTTNAGYVVANSAYAQANIALGQIAFLTGDGITQVQAFQSSYDNSNGAFRVANSGFDRVNTVFTFSNTVYAAVNTLSTSSNAGYVVANAAFGSANSIAVAANNYAGAMSNSGNAWVTATFLPRTGGAISGALSVGSNLTVAGDLTVSGTTTYTNTQTVLVGDNIITLNADLPATVAPTENAGIEVDRGNALYTSLLWNETTDKWTFTNNGSTWDNIAGVTTDIDPVNVRLSAAYVVANASFGTANNRVTGVSGTAGRITSSGGLAPSIDLATAGAGAGTYGGSGVASVTVDAYGRVTGVAAAPAAYLTTSSYVGYSAFSGVVSGSRFYTGYDSGTGNSMSCSNWFRSSGATGWYNDTYSGGINMSDTTYIRTYGSKIFYCDQYILAGGSVRAPLFYDSDNTGYYTDPASTSNVNRINMNYLYVYNGTAVTAELVGGWGSYGSVAQLRTDSNGSGTQDGPRLYYHKAGAKAWAAGIEPGGSNGWGVWEDGSSGAWGSLRFLVAGGGSTIATVSLQTPIMYDYNNTGYYVDPNGSSRMATINADLLRSYGNAYADIYYDNGDTGFYVKPRSVSKMNDVRAYVFYELSNTSYYCDIGSGQRFGGTLNSDYLYSNGTLRSAGETYVGAGLIVGEGKTSSSITMVDTDEGNRVIHNNSGTIGFLNNAGNWRFRMNDSGDLVMGTYQDWLSNQVRSGIFYDNDTGYYFNGNGNTSANYIYANRLGLTRNHGHSVFGIYSSTRYQGVWSMGESYALPDDGTTTGNLYGLAWSYPGGQGGASSQLNSHGLLVLINGSYAAAISSSIRAGADMRAPIFYDSDNAGYYIDPNSSSIIKNLYADASVSAAYMRSYGDFRVDGSEYVVGTSDANYQYSRGNIRAEGVNYSAVYYDHDTGYYINGNAGSSLNTLTTSNHYIRAGSMLYSDHGAWAGDYNKIQWHSSHLYLQNTGGGRLLVLRRGDGGEPFTVDYSGNASCASLYSSGNVTAYSDARLKENVETINNPLDIIRKLRGVTFDWIESKKHSYGLIAQEVEAVVPELVEEVDASHSMDENPNMIKTVDYSKMVSILIEGMKTQQDQIDELKAEIRKLKGE